jgi:hypothetical protein
VQAAHFECLLNGVPDEGDKAVRRGVARAAALSAAEGETYYPAYRDNWSAAWEAYRFRGDPGRTEVVSALAIPYASLRKTARESLFDVDMHVTLADTTSGAIQRATETFTLPLDGAGDASWFLTFMSVESAPANNVALRIRVESSDRLGGSISYGEVDVPDFTAPGLLLSDMIISPANGDSAFIRGNTRLSLAPGRVFSVDEQPDLYYEVYGIAKGAALQTRIEVIPVKENGKATGPGLSLNFDDVAGQENGKYGTQTKRTLGFSSLEAGTYRIRLTVTDVARKVSATQERLLILQPAAVNR